MLAIMTLWRREMLRFWREKARVLAFVGSPLIFWIVLGSGFGSMRRFFPGSLTLTVMFSAVFSTMSLIEDRREGFLLSLLVSPASRTSMVLGKILGTSTLAWIQGLMFLCFAPLAGISFTAGSLAATVAMIFAIAFMFTALGFALAWKMESTQAFHGIINLLLFPLWMVSGAVFTPDSAAGWIRAVMRVNPLTYPTAALDRVLDPAGVGTALPALDVSLLVTAACCVVLLGLAVFVANQRGRRSVA
jgi:ABC-2 type transport system permease protein